MKLCFVLNEDISHLIDYIEHIRSLSSRHEVYLLCTGNQQNIELGSCRVVVIPTGKLPLLAMFMFFMRCADWLRKTGGPDWKIICKQARFCSLLPLYLQSMTCIFDLRSGSVSGFADGIKNRLLALEAARFSHHIVIAASVAEDVLGALPNDALELSVGANAHNLTAAQRLHAREADSISEDTLVLLYVGSITGRQLHRFIHGLKTDGKPMLLLIVGSGAEVDVEQVQQSLATSNIPYRMVGHIPYDQLLNYFATADIGLCYVPVEPRYTHQPPTKLYEYLANGLPVLSTKTEFAKQLPNEIRQRVLFIDNECDVAHLRQWSTEIGQLAPDPAFNWQGLTEHLEEFLLNIDDGAIHT